MIWSKRFLQGREAVAGDYDDDGDGVDDNDVAGMGRFIRGGAAIA